MEWTQRCEVADWPARSKAGLASLPSGQVLLLGGLVGPRRDIWQSTDSGTTWERVADTASWMARSGHGVAVLAGGAVLLAGGIAAAGKKLNDVWRSLDGGNTWHELVKEAPWPPRTAQSLVAMPGGTVLMLGGLGPADAPLNDVWRSTDGGLTWLRLHQEAPWPARSAAAAARLSLGGGDSAVVLVGGLATGDVLLDDVWRSDDAGENWDLVVDDAPWTGRRGHAMVTVPVIPEGGWKEVLLMLGGLSAGGPLNDAWRSADGGTTWELLLKAADFAPRLEHSVAVLKDGAVLLVAGQASATGGYLGDVWRCKLDNAVAVRGASPPKIRPRAEPAPAEAPAARAAAPASTAASSRCGGIPSAGPRYEVMPAEDIRKAVLELQRSLADITRRLDTVATENQLLKEENNLLKDAIDEKIEGSR